MIRKNYYKRITESIVNAYRDTTLDSAMDDDSSENMGKKIVAIITADPDQDLDWESEYEPFGATELTADDEKEAMEHEGMESDHELCPSCGYDVDCEGDECEDDDEMETPMIGGGFEDETEDDYEDMDVKDILVGILQELKGEDSEDSEDEDAFETSDENPMFGGESDDTEDEGDDWEDDDEDEDVEGMLEPQNDWASEESSDDEESGANDESYDDEEDFETPMEDGAEEEDFDSMMKAPQEQEEDEVEIFDSLDNA